MLVTNATFLLSPIPNQLTNFHHSYLLSFRVSVWSYHLHDLFTLAQTASLTSNHQASWISQIFITGKLIPLSHLITAPICSGPDSYIRYYLRLRIMTSLLRAVNISFQNVLNKCSWPILCMFIFLYVLVGTVSILFPSFLAGLFLDFLHQHNIWGLVIADQRNLNSQNIHRNVWGENFHELCSHMYLSKRWFPFFSSLVLHILYKWCIIASQ